MNQKQRILEYLQTGQTLTRLNSWRLLGVIEAPARISELRSVDGYPIRTEYVQVLNKYGEKVRIAKWSLSQ